MGVGDVVVDDKQGSAAAQDLSAAFSGAVERAGLDGEVVVLLISREVDADGSSHGVTR